MVAVNSYASAPACFARKTDLEPLREMFELVVTAATAADDRAATWRDEGEDRLGLRRSTERSPE